MLRIHIALAALFGTAALSAQSVSPQGPAPQTAIIHSVTDVSALRHFDENVAVARQMTDRLVSAVTGQSDPALAWKSLVKPTDMVGIKISTTGGRYRSSHQGVLTSIVSGLEKAGVPRSRIFIWDRSSADLQAAGFGTSWNGISVRAIDPPKGFDPAAKITLPVLGKLIWGDLLFRPKKPDLKELVSTEEALNSDSHLPFILTKQVTRIINVATITDEAGIGIAGSLYNLTVSNVDNNRRFSHARGAYTIPDLYLDERIAPKVALHILDGLVAQYAGGVGFNANYAFAHSTLYGGKDPVALDAHALRLMEAWRTQAKLPAIGRQGAWLQEAESLGAGVAAAERIEVKPVPAAP